MIYKCAYINRNHKKEPDFSSLTMGKSGYNYTLDEKCSTKELLDFQEKVLLKIEPHLTSYKEDRTNKQ